MGLRHLYLRSLVALVALVCYYFGVSMIQVSEDKPWISMVLIFGGYVALGFVFGFLFGRRIFVSFTLVFALGFLGAILSILLYGVLVNQELLSQALQSPPSLFIASFFISIVVVAGTSVNAFLAWIIRRRSRKGKNEEEGKVNEDRLQRVGVI